MTSQATTREIQAVLADATRSFKYKFLSANPSLSDEVVAEANSLVLELLAVRDELDFFLFEPDALLTETAEVAGKLAGVAGKLASLIDSHRDQIVGYESGTFQCKSDCDLCLSRAESPLEAALCHALFTRCIAKG